VFAGFLSPRPTGEYTEVNPGDNCGTGGCTTLGLLSVKMIGVADSTVTPVANSNTTT
jgi:hypothetical protein